MKTMGETALSHRLRGASGVAIALLLFFPYPIGLVVPLRLAAILIGAAAVIIEASAQRLVRPSRFGLVVLTVTAASLGVCELAARVARDRLLAVNLEHLLVLLPLFAGLGVLLIRGRSARFYGVPFLALGTLTALLAIAEWLTKRSLLGRSFDFAVSQREGMTRALVGAEHVLVLGTLFAVAVVLSPAIPVWWGQLRPTSRINAAIVRWAAGALLLVGCWATGSRAAAAVAFGFMALQASEKVVSWIQAHLRLLVAAVGLGLAALAYLSLFVWTTNIPGKTGTDYSTNYRFALHAYLPQILRQHPLGFLGRTPPAGVYMMQSELRGPVDLTASIDSEPLYSIMAFGWIGLLAFLFALLVAIAAIRTKPILGLATLAMTGLGFLMSLHGWDAMSNLWYLLLGACTLTVARGEVESRDGETSRVALAIARAWSRICWPLKRALRVTGIGQRRLPIGVVTVGTPTSALARQRADAHARPVPQLHGDAGDSARAQVTLVGGWGYGNLGDEVLLAGYLLELQRRGVDCDVLSVDPVVTRNALGALSDGLALHDESFARRQDAGAGPVLVCGGGYLNGTWTGEIWGKLLRLSALTQGRRVIGHALELNALDGPRTKARVLDLFRDADLTVRDTASADHAVLLGLPRPTIVPDAVSLLYADVTRLTGHDGDQARGRTLVNLVNVPGRADAHQAELPTDAWVDRCRRFIHTLDAPLGLAIDESDAEFLSGTLGLESIHPTTIEALFSSIAASAGLFSTRMHPALIASLVGTPSMVLPYNRKVRPTLARLGLSQLVGDFDRWHERRPGGDEDIAAAWQRNLAECRAALDGALGVRP